MFQIGQKVVCIDASFNGECRPYMPCWVTQGAIYTIRGIHKDPNIDGYGVYLEEVINPSRFGPTTSRASGRSEPPGSSRPY